MSNDTTTSSLSKDTRDALFNLKRSSSEPYEDVILREVSSNDN